MTDCAAPVGPPTGHHARNEPAANPRRLPSKAAQRCVAPLLDRLDELAEALVAVIVEETPTYLDANGMPSAELRQSCRDNIECVLRLLSTHPPWQHQLYEVPRRIGRRRGEQRIALDAVLRSYRLGGRLIWQAMVELAAEDRQIRREPLLELATSLWTVIDAVSAEVASAYHQVEQDERLLDEQRRSAAVAELLGGAGRDENRLAGIATLLGIPAHVPYLVLALPWATAAAAPEAIQQDSLRAAGIRSLWLRCPEAVLGLVAVPHGDLPAVLPAVRATVPRGGGIGPVAPDLGHIDSAYPLALLAMRANRDRDLARVEDVLPDALLVGAPELGALLVDTVFGRLLELPVKEAGPLLETLRTWLNESCSTAATATRLHCHRNTVLNRLHRIEFLLDRSLDNRDQLLTVSLALNALRLARPDP